MRRSRESPPQKHHTPPPKEPRAPKTVAALVAPEPTVEKKRKPRVHKVTADDILKGAKARTLLRRTCGEATRKAIF
ncbi:MAG TPA: hypothetical protein VFQ35_04640 [Polyangiaceae bacterium]|nr:hypothetical protein [Polyangiaceae bacterium]